MKSGLILGGISALLLSSGAVAQPGMNHMGSTASMGPMNSQTRECRKARDPQRCAIFERAKASCKNKVGPAKKQCLREAMPPVDCAKTRNPERCEAQRKAKDLCKDRIGADHRRCMKTNASQRPRPAAPMN